MVSGTCHAEKPPREFTSATDSELVNRFWAKVHKTDTCWLWTGAVARRYGSFTLRSGKQIKAHRFSLQLATGEVVADGLHVLHVCDVPLCVNPAHLVTGSHADNVRDMTSKGRSWQQRRTHCPAGHPYDEANTHRSGGRRFCRECNRLATQRRRLRRRELAPHVVEKD